MTGTTSSQRRNSLRYKNLKSWRLRTKDRIIKSLGGKCVCCGYDKCSSAMETHHLDPDGKDGLISKRVTNAVSWSKIVIELRKCVLVCANCHREVHAGIAVVPDGCARFNESFSTYPSVIEPVSRCICGRKKAKRRKHCSLDCPKRTDRVEWDKFDLITMKRTMSFSEMGRLIGCSDVMVGKRYRKLTSVKQTGF